MAWRITHVATTPPGWRVRTVHSGEHELRVAFPPGKRRQGSGKLVEILHPERERNCGCRARNPGALVIFGNPEKPNPGELVIFGNEGESDRDQMSELQQAVKVYQAFHGEDPDKILEAQRSAAIRLTYSGMGPLMGLGLYIDGVRIPSPDWWETYPGAVETRKSKIMLACNAVEDPDEPGKTIGTQLYAIGGLQDQFEGVAEQLGEDLSKDMLDLGPLAFVVYLDRKPGDAADTEYMHKFDEPRPDLGYDRLKREIFFAGGAYKIEGLWLHH